MTDPRTFDAVIIGAGMAGLSAAIWIQRLGLSALVLEQAPQPGGQLTAIGGRIWDYPGLDLPRGDALTQLLVRQALEAGATLRLDQPVEAIDAAALSCRTAQGWVRGGALVIATGLSARRLDVPGEAELYQHRLVRRPSHDRPWFQGRRVAVIGGGDRAAENGLILAGLAAQVILLHRGERLRARPALAEPLSREPRISLHLNTWVRSFAVHDGGVTVAALSEDGPVSWEVDAVCIYIGNRPNSQVADGQVALDPQGYILTDRYGLSSCPGIYAAGDVCTPPDFQSLATGAGQAMAVAKRIALARRG